MTPVVKGWGWWHFSGFIYSFGWIWNNYFRKHRGVHDNKRETWTDCASHTRLRIEWVDDTTHSWSTFLEHPTHWEYHPCKHLKIIARRNQARNNRRRIALWIEKGGSKVTLILDHLDLSRTEELYWRDVRKCNHIDLTAASLRNVMSLNIWLDDASWRDNWMMTKLQTDPDKITTAS